MTADRAAAVTDVLYEYCVRVDANHQAEVLELFTDDAVYDHGHGRVYAGKARLAELFRALDDNAATSHHLSNVRVRIAADGTADAHSYLYAYHRRRATGAEVHLWPVRRRSGVDGGRVALPAAGAARRGGAGRGARSRLVEPLPTDRPARPGSRRSHRVTVVGAACSRSAGRPDGRFGLL